MVVDDEEAIAKMLGALLARSLGVETDVFSDPRRAWEAFSADPARFDLLICDLRMPGMDGMEFCRAARRLRAQLPIVILTAYARSEVREEAGLLGIRHVVDKPFLPQPFLALVRSLLGAGSPPASPPPSPPGGP